MTGQDACDLLDADHQKVEMLFTQYRNAPPMARQQLAATICMEVSVHAQIEEELFYPAVLQATREDKLIDEAEREHQEAKDLIVEIETARQPDSLIAELQKAIEHHVTEERTRMFPKARSAQGLDLMALARQLEARKAELVLEYQEG
jgi:iron-sulfur cluster repair protein YtfE (RIC family)